MTDKPIWKFANTTEMVSNKAVYYRYVGAWTQDKGGEVEYIHKGQKYKCSILPFPIEWNAIKRVLTIENMNYYPDQCTVYRRSNILRLQDRHPLKESGIDMRRLWSFELNWKFPGIIMDKMSRLYIDISYPGPYLESTLKHKFSIMLYPNIKSATNYAIWCEKRKTIWYRSKKKNESVKPQDEWLFVYNMLRV